MWWKSISFWFPETALLYVLLVLFSSNRKIGTWDRKMAEGLRRLKRKLGISLKEWVWYYCVLTMTMTPGDASPTWYRILGFHALPYSGNLRVSSCWCISPCRGVWKNDSVGLMDSWANGAENQRWLQWKHGYRAQRRAQQEGNRRFSFRCFLGSGRKWVPHTMASCVVRQT